MSEQTYSIDHNNHLSSKPSTGCMIGGCGALGCGLLLGLPVIGLLVVAYLFFMTPIPINWMSKAIQSDNPGIKVATISGSIMQGFTIPSVEFPDQNDPRRINILKDLKVLYPDLIKSLGSNKFEIEEISVGSARLYVNTTAESNIESGEDGAVGIWGDVNVSTSGGPDEGITVGDGESDLERFLVKKVDINNVELIDPSKGFHFTLDELKLDGIDITPDSFKMGEFRIRSSILDLTLSPIDVESREDFKTSSSLDLEARLKPNDQLKVTKPVHIDGNLELLSQDQAKGKIQAFDGKLTLTLSGTKGQGSIQVDGLNLEDYFAPDFLLPGNITWNAQLLEKEASDTSDTQTGSFTLGDALFKVRPGIPEDPNHALVADHETDGDTITLSFINKSGNKGKSTPAAFQIRSKDNPDMRQRDILAQLYYKSQFDALPLEKKDRILATLGHPMQGEEAKAK